MFAIETDGIRVEAETETEARKELRKRLKQARKEREELAKREAIAEGKARSRAFHVLAKIVSGDDMPRGWQVVRADEQCAVRYEMVSRAAMVLSVTDIEAQGYATSRREVYAHQVDGVLENASGAPMVIWLTETIGEESRPYAIAAESGVVGLVPMPSNVSIAMFKNYLVESGVVESAELTE